MTELLNKISQTDGVHIEQLLNAVLRRYAVLYPDWEICTLSVQRSKDRNKQIDDTIRFLEKMKTSP